MHPRTEVIQSGKVRNLDVTESLTYQGTPFVPSAATDEKSKVSSNDTTAGYLNGKLVAGTNITLTENNNGGNETLTISAAGGGGVTGFTPSQNTAAPNAGTNASRLLVDAATTNADIVLQPKGSGSILAQLPDNTPVGGNKRGAYSVDLQLYRSINNQVAGSDYSAILSGGLNSIPNYSFWTVIAGGYSNSIGISCDHAAILGGNVNVIQTNSFRSVVCGGQANNINATDSGIMSGRSNIVNGSFSNTGGGQSNSISSAATHAHIGGGQSNSASAVHTTIAGGQQNVANQTKATVGGGQLNLSQGNASTVAGGYNNNASGNYSVVGGGDTNVASNLYTVVGGGYNNRATSTRTAIIGGSDNIAQGQWAIVCGGSNNNASGERSSIVGGSDNTCSGAASTISGGNVHSVTGWYSAVTGGYDNGITADYCTVSGYSGSASNFGAFVHSSGGFGSRGQCQIEQYVQRTTTVDGTQKELTQDANPAGTVPAASMRISNDSTYGFEILVTARRTDADNESAAWRITGCIDNNAGTTAFVGTPVVGQLGNDNPGVWSVAVNADNAADTLAILVTGETGKTIRWGACARLMKVTG